MLDLLSLSLAEGGVPHLHDVTIRFEKGRLATLLGRTGAGKTTLMRSIAGLVEPRQGRIALDGRDWTGLPPWHRPVAMVTQQFINYPHLTALDNVAFPLLRRKVPRQEARAAAREMLGRVGLGALVDRRPGQLSGGQQQRVAIARALIKRAPSFCWTNPSSTWTTSCARGCARNWSTFCGPNARRSSSTPPPTRARPCRWAST